jgi:Glycosyl hydrolases family 16/Calx-beta domain
MLFKPMSTFLFCGLLLAHTACVPADNTGEASLLPPPVLATSDQAFTEGDGGTRKVSIPLKLEGLLLSNAVVDYHTEGGSALPDVDFVAVDDGKVLFSPTRREVMLEITLIADGNIEESEDFFIVFSNPRNLEMPTSRLRVTINDDDEEENPYNIPQTGYTSPTSYPGMTLVWQDEFSGDQLDETSWQHEIGTGNNGWGNNELQFYQPQNTFLHDGHLLIEARRESVGGRNFTSSRIITRGRREFRYGRIDIRAALPEGQGIWPALWMLGRNINQIGWPACGEIDIMELVGHQPGRIHGTAHFGASFAQHQESGGSTALSGGRKFSEEFHVFSIVWRENSITWLLNDQPFYSLSSQDVGAAPWPFNQPFFFIFNVAVGGNWPGAPDNTTVFPQRMIVDYVRVFN